MNTPLPLDLELLKKRCVDQPLGPPLNLFLSYSNRARFLETRVTAVSIVQRTQQCYLLFDVLAPEDICQALGCRYDEEQSTFSIRTECIPGDSSGGAQYPIHSTLICDGTRRSDAAGFVVAEARGDVSLRLHHVLDLLRIVSSVLKDHSSKGCKTPSQNRLSVPAPTLFTYRGFVWLILNVLKDFYNPASYRGPSGPSDTEANLAYQDVFTSVSERFLARWSTNVLTAHPSPPRTLLRRPADTGPLVIVLVANNPYFPEADTIIEKSLEEYCDFIRGTRNPTEGYGTITKLTRYQRNIGYNHMFTIMRVDFNMIGVIPFTFWMRVDRSYDRNAPWTSTAISSKAPAKDQVLLALREDLLTEKPETIKNSVTYDFSSDDIPKKVTLRELCKVLKIFSTVSTKYVLLTENCYYLATLVEHILVKGSNHPTKTGNTWVMNTPTTTRGKVMKLWRENRSDESLVLVENETEDIPPSDIMEASGVFEAVEVQRLETIQTGTSQGASTAGTNTPISGEAASSSRKRAWPSFSSRKTTNVLDELVPGLSNQTSASEQSLPLAPGGPTPPELGSSRAGDVRTNLKQVIQSAKMKFLFRIKNRQVKPAGSH